MFTLRKSYQFEAAHRLPNHEGKCKQLHGHSYKLHVICQGKELALSGSEQNMLIDFDKISKQVRPLIENYLDHHYLNDSLNEAHPSCEFIAKWVYDKLKPSLPLLYAIELEETASSSVVYCPENGQ